MRGKLFSYWCGIAYLLTGIPLVGIASVFSFAYYSERRNG